MKNLTFGGAIVGIAIILGMLWLTGRVADKPSPAPTVAPVATQAGLDAAAKSHADRVAKDAAMAAKFATERTSIIAKAKALNAARRYQPVIDLDNDYAWARDPELAAQGAIAREKADQVAAATAKAERRKQGVKIGMTKEEVRESSWGRPQHINSTTNAFGTREQWVYGVGNYLYFDGEILTSIQN